MNAVAHRDYRNTANVQIYIFQDRVEIVTPGGLPAGMSEANLGSKSVPRNPLLFSILYRMRLVEQIGSGIRRILDACAEHGVEPPEMQVSDDWFTVSFSRVPSGALTIEGNPVLLDGRYVVLQQGRSTPQVTPHETPQVTPQVGRLVAAMHGEMSRAELMAALGLVDQRHFQTTYIHPALEAGLIEMTVPERRNSRLQRYRLTQTGLDILEERSAE
ncbi:MAG: hypothetical protein OXI41_03315 [Chloroflexota bacterium]|nr:hypothetical protein [Chloroflexota bacterium]MDE2893777.1 hypothetical protein [Chloroflexota bacterium]